MLYLFNFICVFVNENAFISFQKIDGTDDIYYCYYFHELTCIFTKITFLLLFPVKIVKMNFLFYKLVNI